MKNSGRDHPGYQGYNDRGELEPLACRTSSSSKREGADQLPYYLEPDPQNDCMHSEHLVVASPTAARQGKRRSASLRTTQGKSTTTEKRTTDKTTTVGGIAQSHDRFPPDTRLSSSSTTLHPPFPTNYSNQVYSAFTSDVDEEEEDLSSSSSHHSPLFSSFHAVASPAHPLTTTTSATSTTSATTTSSSGSSSSTTELESSEAERTEEENEGETAEQLLNDISEQLVKVCSRSSSSRGRSSRWQEERKQIEKEEEGEEEEEEEEEEEGGEGKEEEIQEKELEVGKRIGWYPDSSFWVDMVHLARWRGKTVVIKRCRLSSLEPSRLSAFRQALKQRVRNQHPNVVACLGAVFYSKNATPLKIVEEHVEDSGLQKWLRAQGPSQENSWTMLQKLRIARAIAGAMAWLHSFSPPILHRNLTTSNVATSVRDECTGGKLPLVKVSNFGFPMLELESRSFPRKAAPEILASYNVDPSLDKRHVYYSKASDAYAFAILMWELLTQQEPFPFYDNFDELMEAVCQQNLRPPITEGCGWPEPVKLLLKSCWSQVPSQRPSFQVICYKLDLILLETAVRDDEGKRFWLENFPTQHTVEWPRFVKAFYRFLKVKAPLRCRRSWWERSEAAKTKKGRDRKAKLNVVEEAADRRDYLAFKCLKALVVDAEQASGAGWVTVQQFGEILDWFGPISKNVTLPPLLPRDHYPSFELNECLTHNLGGSNGKNVPKSKRESKLVRLDFVSLLPLELSMGVFRLFDEYDWNDFKSVSKNWNTVIQAMELSKNAARTRELRLSGDGIQRIARTSASPVGTSYQAYSESMDDSSDSSSGSEMGSQRRRQELPRRRRKTKENKQHFNPTIPTISSWRKQTILDNMYNVLAQKWFHGHLDANESTNRLQGMPQGTFLVRFSSNATHPGAFTISRVAAGPSIGHIRILRSPSGQFLVNKDMAFDTLPETIDSCWKLLGLFTPCPGSSYSSIFLD